MKDEAYLVLANGNVFAGKSFGYRACVFGEAVFTTGMGSYLETLTDPSYYGQIVIQTFPLIGNYGIIPKDFESGSCHFRAYIARNFCTVPSNFRSEKTIDDFLKVQKVAGVCGIDTRALVKMLREAGVMNALVISGESDEANEYKKALASPAQRAKLLQKIKSYKIANAVEAVTKDADKIAESAKQIFSQAEQYRAVPVKKDGTKIMHFSESVKEGNGKLVALWDFGAKANIRRELLKRGFAVKTVRANASAEEILSLHPDALMLSNGPGNPAENISIIKNLKKICAKRIPVFGICLGHQLLALAKGAKTVKLKYGHRGANQPVKQLKTGRVYISSQNHGYAVENKSLPKCARLSFVNANDGTCEGIEYTDIPAFSVQFHPEAAGGPLDLNFLFDDFAAMIREKKAKRTNAKKTHARTRHTAQK